MPTASTIADRHSVDPTDRSMPPVMMTAVMPSAMIATNAKLRVTLNRFCGVAKVSVMSVRMRHATAAVTSTQKDWRLSIPASTPCDCSGTPAIESSSPRLPAPALAGSKTLLGNFDRSCDQAGDLFGRRGRDRLVGDFASSAQDDDTVSD